MVPLQCEVLFYSQPRDHFWVGRQEQQPRARPVTHEGCICFRGPTVLLVSSLASLVQGRPRSHTPGPRKEPESHNSIQKETHQGCSTGLARALAGCLDQERVPQWSRF